jgi:hypothetical protein
MALDDKIEKVKKVEKAAKPATPIDDAEELKRLSPNKERFDNLMESSKSEKVATQSSDPTKKTTVFDEAAQLSSKTDNLKVTPTELIAQTEAALYKIDDIKSKLETPGLEFKDSVKPVLADKLTHINDNIRIALTKAGVEISETPAVTAAPPAENAVLRFLGLLTDGQYKLQTLAAQVDQWHLNKTDINPASMLAVQIKVNYITQELEFFSSLLNKALESTKTIMNVQV